MSTNLNIVQVQTGIQGDKTDSLSDNTLSAFNTKGGDMLTVTTFLGRSMGREDNSAGSRTDGIRETICDPIVQRALEIIWSHSRNPLSVGDIARQLPVTRRTLDRRFTVATGHSVLEEIHSHRLSLAKRLLVETDLPVKSVAHLTGFSSTERMRVLFVNRIGISPSQYRQKQQRAEDAENI